MAIVSFFSIMISMLAIDALWLGIMYNRFYTPHIGHLLSPKMGLGAAAIFYILFAFALNVFVVLPGIKNNSGYFDLLLMGMLFGAVTYGTYDLTNQATLRSWPWVVTLVDIAWGGILTAAVSLIAASVTRYFY